MNKYKLELIISIFCLFFIGSVDAATHSLYLDNADIKAFSHPSVTAEFKYSHGLVMNDMVIHDSGKMMITPSQGLCWKMTSPFKRVWMFSPYGDYEISENGEVFDISTYVYPSASVVLNVVRSLDSGNISYIEKNFNINVIRDRDNHIMSMTLESTNSKIKNLFKSIAIEMNGNYMSSIKIIEKNGSYNLIEYTNVKEVEDSYSVFKDFCHVR